MIDRFGFLLGQLLYSTPSYDCNQLHSRESIDSIWELCTYESIK